MAPLAKSSEDGNTDCAASVVGSLPLVAHFDATLSRREQERLREIAARLLEDDPALRFTEAFGPDVLPGRGAGPTLLIGDHREVALTPPDDAALYEYRISALAGEGHMLLMSCDRNIAFERYRERTLGLGALDVIHVPTRGRDGRVPLATRCHVSAKTLDRVASEARAAGGLSIVPYIGMGSAWLLAGKVAEAARVPVRVAAPPPRLTRKVNDKVWFTHCVADILGTDALPSYRAIYGPAALAAHAARLAREADRIVVKVPDSAGSMGNIAIEASDIRAMDPRSLHGHLLRVLGAIGWHGRFPLLIEIWDAPVLASPSVQVWIPLQGDGPPMLEGMFEQHVTGKEGTFIGSRPASLPERWTHAVMSDTFKIATVFQRLGYFGRCSFDAVIAGRRYRDGILHWIECNGRWGGVSIPMTLANRLTGDWARSALVVEQLAQLGFPGHPFADAVDLSQDLLYRPGAAEGIVFLSPHGIEWGCAINLLAIAKTVERAEDLARRITRRMIERAI